MLAIGRSAIAAYRQALSTVGNNVANAQTPGYVRRRTELSELPLGSGVAGTATVRVHDAFADRTVRTAAERSGRVDTGALWLGRIETVLETGADGVGASLSRFFTAGARLASDPASTTLRAGFVDALGSVAESFNRAGAGLLEIGDAVRIARGDALAGANMALDELSRMNAALRREPAGTDARAGLEDERDRMLDALAATLPFGASFANDGSVTLRPLDAPDPPLLDASGAAALTCGSDGLQISHPAGTRPLLLDGGTLAGLAESGAALDRRIADLDALANSLASALNGWSLAGTTPSGAAGGPLITGDSATSLTLAPIDGGSIAAAANGETNGNLLALADVRHGGGFEDRWDGIVVSNASMLAKCRAQSDAATLALEGATAARDAIGRVELDDEASAMLALQQGYNAAARVLQVSRETVDTLLTRL